MKPDVLTLAVVIFVVGVLASSFGVTDVFQSESRPVLAEYQPSVSSAYASQASSKISR
jgi:hypothetical protein